MNNTTRDKRVNKNSTSSHRNPTLLSHYHDCTSRLFYNGGRANEYLHNHFLRAAKNGELERIRNFLTRSSKTCNVNIDYKDKKSGNTAVVFAASGNHVEIVRLLLNYGADITLCNYLGQSVLDLSAQPILPMLLASVDRQGASHRHLLQAAWQGNTKRLKRLLSSQAEIDVNCKNADGMTPLLLVTRDVCLFEKIEKTVMEKGYNPVEVVKELLHHKADCSITSQDGKNPLHYIAINKGKNAEDMVNLIVNGMDSGLDVPDASQYLPMHLASRQDNCPVLLALINAGGDVNARGHGGQTPLHMAAAQGHDRCSTTLLDNGADVTLVDDCGYSPVDLSKSKTVIHVLKEAWADQTRESSYRGRRSNSAPTLNIDKGNKVLNKNTGVVLAQEKRVSSKKVTMKEEGMSNMAVKVDADSLIPHPPREKCSQVTQSKSLNNTSFPAPSPYKASGTQYGQTMRTRQIIPCSADTKSRQNQQKLELPRLSIKNMEFSLTSSIRNHSQSFAGIQRLRHLGPTQPSFRLHSQSLPATSITHSYRSTNSSVVQNTERMKIPTRIPPLSAEQLVTYPKQSQGPLQSGQGLECNGRVIDLDLPLSDLSSTPSLVKIVMSDLVDKDLLIGPPPSTPCHDSDGPECAVTTETNILAIMNIQEDRTIDEQENKYKSKDESVDHENGEDDPDYKTQTLSTTNISTFWIPYTTNNENNLVDTDKVKNEASCMDTAETVIHQNTQRSRTSSVSYYVDLNDVQKHTQCCLCNKRLNKLNKSLKCNECEAQGTHSEKKTFWISLDGETSDGEKGVNPAITPNENQNLSTLLQRACSLPGNVKLGIEPCLETKLHSEDTFVIETQKDDANKAENIHPDTVPVSGDAKVISVPSSTELPNSISVDDISVPGSNYEMCTGKVPQIVPTNGVVLTTVTSCDSALSSHSIQGSSDKQLNYDVESSHPTGMQISLENTDSKSTGIVLQSLNRVDDDDDNTTLTLNHDDHSDDGLKVKPGNTETSKPLKAAWSHDQPTMDVQIRNAFPSPEPPVTVKPQVQLPIGGIPSSKAKKRKPYSGKQNKKCCKANQAQTGTAVKGEKPSANQKDKKGKKGKKKKQTYKEISVNQSAASVASVYDHDQGEMLSPDEESTPTLSIDSRTFSCKLLRRKFPTLSPIPESPCSSVPTPNPVPPDSVPTPNPVPPDSVPTPNPVPPDSVLGDDDDSSYIGHKSVIAMERSEATDHVGSDVDAGLDEVDGGMLSRLIGMCVPRFSALAINSDSEGEEENHKLVASKQTTLVDDEDFDEHDDDDDHGNNELQSRTPCNEVDEDVENMIQQILQTPDNGMDVEGPSRVTKLKTPAKIKTSCELNNIVEDENKRTKQNSVKGTRILDYLSQMDMMLPGEFESLDDVFIRQEDNGGSIPALSSSELEENEENELSDNDSSYISCDSTPRGVSDCSTYDSNDSVLSSQDTSRGGTPSSQTDTASGSVDIHLHEHMHKLPSATGSSDSSGDSRSMLRAKSTTNNSTVASSFFPSKARGFMLSQISSGSGSQSSTASCGEEIQWQKGSILGRGGFGTVWLGLVDTGEMIAVKQVELNHNDESEAEKQYERLQEEVSLLRSLRHVNIVKYIGTRLDDNSIVNIFMEFVPGGSIAQALKRFGAFVEPVFQRYTKQILFGVDYLHRNNIIHRDIKGGNIMLMPNGVIKLIDFGCAKRLCLHLSLSKSRIVHSMKGTPYWMAPEVIKETGDGTKSDVWSIGCTVFEMATGNPPWSDMPPMLAIFTIGNGSTVPLLKESFSTLARHFTTLCMTRDPNSRPSTSELLQHEFITGQK